MFLPVSQIGADRFVMKATGHKKNGFFIEAGASDGVSASNTFLLERQLGWTGLCVEPLTNDFQMLRLSRPGCIVDNSVLGARNGDTISFVESDGDKLLSGVAGTKHQEVWKVTGNQTQRTTSTLGTLLDK